MKANCYLILLLFCYLPCVSAQQLVANINQGNTGSDPTYLQGAGEYGVFSAGLAGGEKRLYVVKGASGKAEPFMDQNDEQVVNPEGVALIDGMVYYYTQGQNTTSYYRADLATRTVVDLGTLESPGVNGGDPDFTKVAGGVIFFHVGVSYDRQLYATDGTAAGTRLLFDLPREEFPGRIVPFGDRAFIEFYDNQDTESVYGLSDGTEAGSGLYYPSDGSTVAFALSTLGSDLIVSTRADRQAELYLIESGSNSLTPTSESIPTLPEQYVGGYTSGRGYTYYLKTGPGTEQLLGRIDTATRVAETVLDLNPTGESRRAGSLQVFDDLIFFRRYDVTTQQSDIYRTDGTPTGTFLLLEGIEALSVNGFSLGEMVAAGNGTYYFLADRAASGIELWRTDGTRAGTRLVKDLYPGPGDAEIDQLTAVGGTLFFAVESPDFGREVFRTDGTERGTVIVADINQRESSSFPTKFLTYNDTLYFSATTGCTGYELFKSGGTAATTSLLADLTPGRNPSFAAAFTTLGGRLYFGVSGRGFDPDRIFRTDGTVTEDIGLERRLGTSRITLSGPGSINGLLVIQGFFGGVGQSLYAFDPATDSLSLLKVFSSGGGNSFGGSPFIALNDSVLLFQEATPEFGVELWRTDGTAAGTYMVKDIRQVNEQGTNYHIGGLTVIDDIAYFSADADGFGSRPYRSDGTEAGTYELGGSGFLNSPGNFTAYAGRVYFTAGFSNNYRLYATAGGRGDVEESAITRGGGTSFESIRDLTVLGEKLVFTASTGATGNELWAAASSDATADLLEDLSAGPAGSFPRDLTVLGDAVYFSVDIPELGRELWSTDGTPGGTVVVADINSGTASGDPSNFYVYKGYLYFRADNGSVGSELWRYSPEGKYDDQGDPNVISIACASPTDTTTSVSQLLDVNVSIFPNPTSDRVAISLSADSQPVTVALYGGDGRQVYSSGAATLRHDIPVNHLPSGTYVIRLLEQESGRIASRPLVVVH